jgi:hypothetical protein
MRGRLALVAAIALMALVPGCQCWRQFTTDIASQTSGLDRAVVLYDYNGHVIGSWRSRTVIDADSGGLTTFFDSTGHRVLINGGILVSVER